MGRGGDAVRGIDVVDYLRWTRDLSVSWAYLLPLLAAYEVGILWSGSGFRNAAELAFKEAFGGFPSWCLWLQHLVLAVVIVVAIDLIRRDVPVLRLYPVFLLEAALFALLLGPLIGLLVDSFGLRPAAVPGSRVQQYLLSIGAGIYEEIVFRFLLMAGLYVVLVRAFQCSALVALAASLLFSATLFSLYHHLGPGGEPWVWSAVSFRFLAGILLGVILAVRGLALCVYLHAFYDLLCDLKGQALLS